MKKTLSAGLLCAVLALLSSPLAPAQQSAAPPSGLAGHWTAKVDFWGTPLYFQMELKRDGPILKGTFGGDTLTGTASGSSLHDGTEVHFLAKDDQGGTEQCDAILKDGVMTGNLIFTDPPILPILKRIPLPRVPCENARRIRPSAMNSRPPSSTGNSPRSMNRFSAFLQATRFIPPPWTPAAPMNTA